MTRFIHDQFAKQYLTELLTPYGEVETSKDITAEVRQIDLLFMGDINQRIREANGRLKANCFGVTIEQIGSKLYLRATLPPKPSSSKSKPYQQKISITSANNEGVKISEREAKKLSIRLDAKTFDWADYIVIPDNVKTIGSLILDFEKDYFNRRERNFKTETTWRVEYQTVFKILPVDKILDAEICRQAILSTKPDTRTRQRFCMVCGLLAKFAKITFDPSPYKGNYSPKSRSSRLSLSFFVVNCFRIAVELRTPND